MLGLIYKDFVSQKWVTFMTFGYIMFFSTVFISMSGSKENNFLASRLTSLGGLSVLVMIFIFGSMIPEQAFATDNISKWNIYAAVLPTSPRKTVLARYSVMLMMYCFSFAVSVITLAVSAKVSGGKFDIYANILFFSLVTALDSVSYAFYYRFGMKKGGIFKMIFLIILPVAFIFYLLFGDLSVFGENGIGSLMEWLVELDLTNITQKLWLPALIIAAVFVTASYFISCAVYRKGIETAGEGDL